MGTAGGTPRKTWQVGDLVVDEGRQCVSRGDVEIELPKLSFDVLLVLIRDAPNFVSIDALLARAWAGLVVNPETVVQRIKLLRDALDDRAAEPRYIAASRGRGYRLVAPVTRRTVEPELASNAADVRTDIAQVSAPADAAVAAASYDTTRPGTERHRRAWAIYALGGLLLVAAVGGWILHRRTPPVSTSTAEDVAGHTVAVLPFDNLSRHQDDAVIALGVPDIVLDRLVTVDGLTVVARDSAVRATQMSTDPVEIGQRLHAGFLVDGTVQRSGTTLRITARLVDARTQQQLWSTRYDRPVEDLFAVQDGIAEQVATALSERLPGLRGPAAADAPTRDIEAYLAWLRGKTLVGRYTAAKADAAAREFEHAIERDPAFSAAYAALYDARMQAASLRFEDTAEVQRRQRPLLDRARALDPHSGAVLFARAMWDDLDDATREATFREAVAQDPGNSRGLTSFAVFLDLLSLRGSAGKARGAGLFPPRSGPTAPRGDARDVEATRLLKRAIAIDPLFVPARYAQFDRAELGRRDSEKRMEELLAIDPDFYPALERLANYRWLFHDSPSQALELIERAIAADPQNPFARQAAASFYLEIGDDAAADDVARATPVSAATAAPAIALYAGDWRAAGTAARSESSYTFDVFHDYGAAPALRDLALHTQEYRDVEDLLCERYAMSVQGPVQVELYNFRPWVLLAHLELVQGREARAREILESVIAWIDADRKYGPVYNRRTRAQAQMLLGRPEEALRELEAAFRVDHDHVEWRYTVEHDPIFSGVRHRPEFQALATEGRRFAARERDAVEALRSRGVIPRRPVTAASVASAVP